MRRQFLLLLLAALATARCALSVNPVLNIKETFPYLIDRNDSSKIIEPRDYMDFENLYTPSDTYKAQQTIQGRNYYMLKAFDFANYFQSDYWHYSSEEDLRRSALPVANELVCAQQLDWLERQVLNSSDTSLYLPGEQHVQLASLMDSFGRPQASTYLGHGYWLGSYYECLLASIDMDKYETEPSSTHLQNTNNKTQASASDRIIRTRYCVGKARDKDWPLDDNYVPRISYKVGLCLPETCQTLTVQSERHRRQIERLMQFNMPEHVRRSIKLDDMYCLPDKRSPIREFGLSTKIFLALLGGWLVASLISTALYSCLRRHQKDLRHLERQMRQVDLSAPPTKVAPPNGSATIPAEQQLQLTIDSTNDDDQTANQNNLVNYIIHQANQHTANLMSKSAPVSPSLLICGGKPAPSVDDNQLEIIEQSTGIKRSAALDDQEQSDSRSVVSSCTSSGSSLSAWLKGSPALIRALQALSITENVREFSQPPKVLRDPRASLRLRINMNALDAIKCLCCILVVFGHIVFIHMQHMTNIVHTIELSHDIAPRVLIAFFNFVDTFFIISGMLTTYFIFKRFNKRSFSNPIIWLTISLFRLIRLSPVYLLVFWFVKTLSVHLGEGPLWDYGTDKNSIKGLCINDHWWKSLLYLGNWGTMQPLCILPAWSIIVDAQYSLLVPPIIFLIFRHKRLGYLGLLIAVIISTGNMSYQLATQTAVKTSDMAKIRLHVYPLISRFAAEFYNTAWNRLGPIAVGILGGHMLYLYDIGHIRRWPFYMRGACFKFVLILHMLIFILPTIGRLTEANSNEGPSASSSKSSQADNSNTGEPDMLVFILSNATIKPIWSIINTIFLLRLITDLRQHSVLARLASHNIWHCLGKLCFASYLIHYEIILLLLKMRQNDLMEPSWCNIAREFSLAFLISIIVAYFIYVLFEAPINKLIMLNIDKSHLVKNQSTPAPPSGVGGAVRLPTDQGGQVMENGDDGEDSDETGNFTISDTPTTAASGGDGATTNTNTLQSAHQNNYRYQYVHDKRTKEEQLANMA